MLKYIVYFLFFYLLSVVFFTVQDIPNGVIESKKYRFLFVGITTSYILLALFLFPKINKIELNRIDIFLITFLIWTVINSFILNHQSISITLSVFICSTTLSLILKQFIKTNSNYLSPFIYFCVLIGGLEALIGFFQLQGYLVSFHYAFKMTGNFHNPAPFGIYIAAIFVFGLGNVLFTQNIRLEILSKIVCLICLLVLPSSESRSAWIGVIVGSLYLFHAKYGFDYYKKYFNNKYVISGTLISMLGLIITLWNYKVNSAVGRILIWKVSFEIAKKNLFTGIGFGEFINQYGFYQADFFRKNPNNTVFINLADNVEHVFNDYLQILVENGLITFIVYILTLYIILFSKPIRMSDHFHPVKAGLLVIVSSSFFSYPLTMIPIWWLFLFFTCLISIDIKDTYSLKIPYFIKILIVIVTGVISLNVLRYFSNEYDAKKKWYRANVAVKRENFKVTESLYTEAIKNLPNEKSIMVDYGIILLINGKPKQSVEILEKASKSVSNQYLFSNLGKGYQQIEKYDLAEKAYLQSINMIPNRMFPRYLLAKMYLQKQDTIKAKEIAKQIINMKVKVPSEKTKNMLNEMRQLLLY